MAIAPLFHFSSNRAWLFPSPCLCPIPSCLCISAHGKEAVPQALPLIYPKIFPNQRLAMVSPLPCSRS